MKTKRFKFDFNENADPVSELHRYRVALSKRFKTTEALINYYRTSLGDDFLEEKPATPTKNAEPQVSPKKRNTKRPKVTT